jgi:hypothetical protein
MRLALALPVLLSLCLGSLSCGQSCTLKGCLEMLTFEVRDEAGSYGHDLRGTVRSDNLTVSFDCGASGASVSTDPPSSDAPFVLCESGSVGIGGITEGDVELDITDSAGRRFQATVTPVYQTEEDFNGPGCGSCTSGSAQVVLR